MLDDIEYRIANLRFELKNIESLPYDKLGFWDKGYNTGRKSHLESELRFLEGLFVTAKNSLNNTKGLSTI